MAGPGAVQPITMTTINIFATHVTRSVNQERHGLEVRGQQQGNLGNGSSERQQGTRN
jgi:hypothetical protein